MTDKQIIHRLTEELEQQTKKPHEVYVLVQVSWDYHRFETVVDVGGNIDVFAEVWNDMPIFEENSEEENQFIKDNEMDGYTHYTYKKFEVSGC